MGFAPFGAAAAICGSFAGAFAPFGASLEASFEPGVAGSAFAAGGWAAFAFAPIVFATGCCLAGSFAAAASDAFPVTGSVARNFAFCSRSSVSCWRISASSLARRAASADACSNPVADPSWLIR